MVRARSTAIEFKSNENDIKRVRWNRLLIFRNIRAIVCFHESTINHLNLGFSWFQNEEKMEGCRIEDA